MLLQHIISFVSLTFKHIFESMLDIKRIMSVLSHLNNRAVVKPLQSFSIQLLLFFTGNVSTNLHQGHLINLID